MGGKSSSKQTKKKQKAHATTEYSPFFPFTEGRGRRTLRSEYLVNRVDNLTYALGSRWVEIQFDLQRAKTHDDIVKAFGLVANWPNSDVLAPFLRTSRESATSQTIKETDEQLAEVGKQFALLDERFRAQSPLCEEADRAVTSVSDETKLQREDQLKGYRKSLRGLRIEISNQKGLIRRLELARGKGTEGADGKRNVAIREAEGVVLKLEEQVNQIERRCGDIRQELSKITPKRTRFAVEEAASRRQSLSSLEQVRNEALDKQEKLLRKRSAQEAYCCQEQLLQFLRNGKFAHDNPRSLANAIAGLPYLSARRSAELCSTLEVQSSQSHDYEVFKFMESALKRRDAKRKLPLVDWIKQEVIALPKSRLVDKKRLRTISGSDITDETDAEQTVHGADESERERCVNSVRKDLADNWGYLKRAIQDAEKAKYHPLAMASEITKNFRKRTQTTDAVDRLFAQREKISD